MQSSLLQTQRGKPVAFLLVSILLSQEEAKTAPSSFSWFTWINGEVKVSVVEPQVRAHILHNCAILYRVKESSSYEFTKSLWEEQEENIYWWSTYGRLALNLYTTWAARNFLQLTDV